LKPSQNPRTWGLAVFAVALAPALAAIWAVPWFVTQDGPAHVYNAQVLAWSFDPGSPFREVYTIQWQPIPNWAGHLMLAGLVAGLPAWMADRIMTSLTLAGFAAAILWLRWCVAGSRGLVGAALLAALLALNLTWLLGFSSFLFGACLFAITLGYWWSHHDHLSSGHLAVLAALLVLGYFCHLVSLGLTVLGLVVLALTSPLPDSEQPRRWRPRLRRLALLSISFIPLVPLGLCYLRIAQRGGPMHPLWENLADPFSLLAWKAQITWADPLTLARKDGLPFTDRANAAYILVAPVVWLVVALAIWGFSRIWNRLGSTRTHQRHEQSRDRGGPPPPSARTETGSTPCRRGWLILAAMLLVGGVAGPDTMGPNHGDYLPQRVLLLGLVALVPVVDIDPGRWSGRAAAAALVLALALQSAIVWDYGLHSDHTAGQVIRAREAVGRNQRVVALPVSIRSRFRANPLLHVESWLGVDSGNVAWNNYETRHYYFPVHFQPGIDRPQPDELERILRRDDPLQAAARSREWERILSAHASSIDVLLVYQSEPRLDAITRRWFEEVERRGDVRIFHRSRMSASPPSAQAQTSAPQG
jgi:hypothetical protein